MENINLEDNLAIQNILNRKSVRQFTDKAVEKEKIEILLKCAMAAPSARNRQPWKYVVVDDRDLLDKLAEELPYAKMLFSSTLGIVVCGDVRDKEDLTAQSYWPQDCSAATQNILLAAEAMGLGACWTACYPKEDRETTTRKFVNMPEGINPFCVIAIGYPARENQVIDKWKEENIFYNTF